MSEVSTIGIDLTKRVRQTSQGLGKLGNYFSQETDACSASRSYEPTAGMHCWEGGLCDSSLPVPRD